MIGHTSFDSGRGNVDEETRRYAAIFKIKQARLNILDEQAATFGIAVPPHIEMERVSLRAELSAVSTAIESPIRAEATDELGPAGRFVVNYQQNREIKQSIAIIANKLDDFIEQSLAWRAMHRQWILIIGVVVVLILVIVVAIVTYLVTAGNL